VAPPRQHRPRHRVGTAVVAAGIALAAVLAWQYWRLERRRWARDEAIPQIARLEAQDLPLAAFLLAKQAQPYLPPDFERTRKEKSRLVEVTSSPPGATVEIQDYLTPQGAWYRLGATPMEKVVVPEGYFRWRVSKAGVGQYVAAPETSERLSFPLQPAQPVPQGMTSVPGGRFFGMIDFIGWLGPYDLPAFSIDRLEVTNREYQAFVDAGGYQRREYWREPVLRDGRTLGWDEAAALFRDRTGRPGPATWEAGHYPEGQGEMPVSGVSWYEASAYAAYSGKSLPALAQWFQAAPPELAPYTVRLSNFSGSAPARVGSFAGVGPYGTYDMAGNVREWTRNPCAGDQRFILGGAWSSQTYLSADPETLPALDRSPQNGIRCVRNAADLPAAATGLIRTHERDFRHAKPVEDAVFRAYAPLYAYDKTPLEARVEGEPRDTPDWQEHTISIAAAYGGERLPIHLFLPKRVHPPFQTVVFFPSARVLLVPDSHELGDLPFVDYVIQSGRALLYPIYQGTYERRVRFELPGASQTTGLVTERFKDLGRALDYLATRSDIDHDRLAYLGVSMGAAEGVIYATLIQDRLKAVVLLDGGLFLNPRPAGIDQLDFAPRLKKPVLMVNGRYDFTFSLEHAQRPLLEWIGTPAGDKRHVVLQSPHDVSTRRAELVPEVLGWLDKYLGRVE
jgi:formylglycine-generating enzyme required for sulfatase activity